MRRQLWPLSRLIAHTLLLLALALAACGPSGATAQGPGSAHTSAPRPSPTPIPKPISWLTNSTLLTIYGRGFDNTPILGRLGFFHNFADMANSIQLYVHGITPNNRRHRVLVAVHLIYAIATGCGGLGDQCLGYLDDNGVNIIRDYIQPAARRGWLVILDDQLGKSWPAHEVQRMIGKGYLRYDNVEVALDPEFRTRPDQITPGIPVGSVDSSELNRAQEMLNGYAAGLHLRHHKIMIIHQFMTDMIARRQRLRRDLPYVDRVLMADGFGDPLTKAQVYNTLLGPGQGMAGITRGIKLFFPNPYEQAGHFDSPVLDWRQVFGWSSVMDPSGVRYFLRPPPTVICIA